MAANPSPAVRSIRVFWDSAPSGEWRFAASPVVGESPISAELSAVLQAAYRPMVDTSSPPADPPALPVIAFRRAGTDPRGDGLRITAAGRTADLHLEGHRQNIVADLPEDQAIELCNVRSLRAWRGAPADVYEGQGLYSGRSGPITLRGCLFGWNGWQPDKPWPAKNRYRHGVYQDLHGGYLTAEDCIFAYNAACGAQVRNGATFRRCLFVGNAINLLAVRGDVTLEDCVFYGASRYVELNEQNQPRSFQGNAAIMAYTTVRLKNVLLAAWPGQAEPNREIVGLPSWNIGAINAARGHDKNPASVGRITATDCVVAGWPDASGGGPFTGDPGFNGTGFASRAGPIDVRLRIDSLLAAVLMNRVSIPQAVAEGMAAVRQAVG